MKPANVIRDQGRILFFSRTVTDSLERHEYTPTGQVGAVPVMFYNPVGEAVVHGYESLDAEIEANDRYR